MIGHGPEVLDKRLLLSFSYTLSERQLLEFTNLSHFKMKLLLVPSSCFRLCLESFAATLPF